VVTGDVDFDAHPVVPTLLVMTVRRLDEDAATDDAVEERLEVIGPFSYVRLQRSAGRDLVKRDLKWGLHESSTLRRVCQATRCLRAHGDDRAEGVPDDLFGDAAEKDAFDPRAAVGSHHDEIASGGLRFVEEMSPTVEN
jgi:hypothetical protein